MSLRCTALLLALVAVGGLGRAEEPAPSRVAGRALLVSIDGLRPDLMLRADAPNLHALLHEGSFSMWARTTEVSITLPSHTSMITGVVPQRHGILYNDDLPTRTPTHPLVPTLLQLAHAAGYSTALVAGKSKFSALAADATFHEYPARRHEYAADEVATRAVGVINAGAPDVMLLHFGDVDGAGHSFGWGSPEQLAAIHRVDAALGVVLAALKSKHLYDSTILLVTADHGGTGHWHGPNDPRARTIPWIVVGPSIRRDVDLTMDRALNINTEDTFATLCMLLGLQAPSGIDGHPVTQILAPPPSPAAAP